MILSTPYAPYSKIKTTVDTLSIDINSQLLVLPTINSYIPTFNQHVLNTNRCTKDETPCGGFKNSTIPDYFPGTVSITGAGGYLQNIARTYTGKVLSAGKLSENNEILNTGPDGLYFCTADGVEYKTGDGVRFSLVGPSMIVVDFRVINITDSAQTYTIVCRCPDSIKSVKLYNIDTYSFESVKYSYPTQTFGTINSVSFVRDFTRGSSVQMQLMIEYNDLSFTYQFSNDASKSTGIQNFSSPWIAYYDPDSELVNFLLFSQEPDNLAVTLDKNTAISQLSLPMNGGLVYNGNIIYTNPSESSIGSTIPDCINEFISGSLAWNLKHYSYYINTSNIKLNSYIVPPISDTKILPSSTVSNSYSGSTITIKACRGEYTPASFVLNSNTDVNLNLVTTDLVSDKNTISTNNIDVKIVKCWYQAGHGVASVYKYGRFLTPELLLNDDSLIAVAGDEWERGDLSNPCGKNYLKLNTGEYLDISTSTPIPTPTNFADATTLQSINLPKQYNKQIWLTFHIPTDAVAGTYIGNINIKAGNTTLKQLTINLTVLPFELSAASIWSGLYYRVKLTTKTGVVSTLIKTPDQYRADIQNMLKHGIRNTTIYSQDSPNDVSTLLGIRQSEGMDNSSIYYSALSIASSSDSITAIQKLAASYGTSMVYVYGFDEQDLNTEERRAMIDNVHSLGAKVFCAQYATQATGIADKLDVAVVSYELNKTLAETYHENGNKIFSYCNPQSVPEYPRTSRLNYGLALWQNDYDAAFDFTYQFDGNNSDSANVWNDFDANVRDHCFTYPTINGPVDTIQWEGYREASNDLRYLATLQAAITVAKSQNINTNAADSWLNNLKSMDLSNADLDSIRSQMIAYILSLQG